jgi:hypothetical protein
VRCGFLDADVEFGQTAATAAVGLRHVHTQKPSFAQRRPQSGRLLALVDDVLKILPAKLTDKLADRIAQITMVFSSVAERVLEQFRRHQSSLHSFRPSKKA